MKIFFTILLLLSFSLCNAQREEKTLAYITKKGDTVIVDTMGFIRHLLQEIDDLEKAHKLLLRDIKFLRKMIDQVYMIIWWKPEEDEQLIL